MKVMFYGMTGGSSDVRVGGGYVPHILISAASLRLRTSFRKTHFPRHDSLFLDSGGFSFFYKSGEYPFTPEELAALAVRERANYCAVMDYPCEPETSRPAGLRTNRERIDRTIENTRRCLQICNVNWVPVVQGYTPEEYAYCVERLRNEDLIRPVVAIGSLCVRRRTEDTWEILSLVRDLLPGVKLHGFGIDLKFLRDRRIKSVLWSADTQAWGFNNRRWGLDRKGWRPKSMAERHANYPFYSAEVRRLLRMQEAPLETFPAEAA